MIAFWIVAAVVVLLGLLFALLPLRAAPQVIKADIMAEELEAEVASLKEEARTLQGSQRKRALGRIVFLEKKLAEARERGAAVPKAKSKPGWALAAAALLVLASAAALGLYVLPKSLGAARPVVASKTQPADLQKLKKLAEEKNDVDSWTAYADKAWQEADYTSAAEAYKKVLDLDDKNLHAWKRMGILFFMSGYPKDAAGVLSVVVSFNPKDTEALLFLGNAYSATGRFREAVNAWKAYIAAGGAQKEYVEGLISDAKKHFKDEATNPNSPLPAGHPKVAATPQGAAEAAGGAKEAAGKLPAGHPAVAPEGMEGVVDGKIVYRNKCAACHGQKGEGGAGPALHGNPVIRVDGAVEEIVRRGSGTMPAIEMSDEELKALVDYIKQEL